MYYILALLLLGVLIMAHEAGHFLAARACGIGVQEFAMGMGPLLLKKKSKKGTQFSLRLFPIGGYCQFYGEDEDLPDPRAFNRQAVWKRAVTVASGPLMNFIVAFLVIVLYMSAVGLLAVVPNVAQVEPNAQQAGLMPGDELIAVNGEAVTDTQMIALAIDESAGESVTLTVQRDGEQMEIAVTPFYDEELVRAVYAMQTPVVSAVGHETDFSLVDFVADARAATPTAAGELVAYDYYALCEKVADCTQGMKRGVKRVFERRVARTGMACAALERRITGFSNEREKRVRNLVARARLATEKRVASAESAVERLAGKLDALSPLKVLARGYFNVQAAGSTVTSVRSLKRGDTVTARGKDGSFEATVTEVYPSENNQ